MTEKSPSKKHFSRLKKFFKREKPEYFTPPLTISTQKPEQKPVKRRFRRILKRKAEPKVEPKITPVIEPKPKFIRRIFKRKPKPKKVIIEEPKKVEPEKPKPIIVPIKKPIERKTPEPIKRGIFTYVIRHEQPLDKPFQPRDSKGRFTKLKTTQYNRLTIESYNLYNMFDSNAREYIFDAVARRYSGYDFKPINMHLEWVYDATGEKLYQMD